MSKVFKKKEIKIDGNIIKLEIDDTTVEKVINFYNEAPFPNYEDNDDKSSINQKGDNNYLANQFKNFIGFNKDILEVGCGTGQLSIYFSILEKFPTSPTKNLIFESLIIEIILSLLSFGLIGT